MLTLTSEEPNNPSEASNVANVASALLIDLEESTSSGGGNLSKQTHYATGPRGAKKKRGKERKKLERVETLVPKQNF